MFIYFMHLFSIPVYAILIELSSLKRSNKSLILCFILFFQFCLLASIRAETVGSDLYGYIEVFKRTAIADWDQVLQVERFEVGYMYLNKLLSVISDTGRCLMIGVGICTTLAFVRYIYKNSKIVWLSFFLFVALGFYTSSFNIYRQFIAMSILVNAIDYVRERKFWKFLLLVLFAACFHITSVIYLLLYPLFRIKISWTYFGIAFGIAVVIGNVVAPLLLKFLIGNYFQLYVGEVVEGTGYGMLGLLLIVTAGGLLLKTRNNVVRNDIFYHIMIIACCLQIASLHFALFARVVLYFSIHMVIFIPNALAEIRVRELKGSIIVIVCIFTYFYFYSIILYRDLSSVVPYQFMWE